MIKYFKELLATLKSIDESLKELRGCVRHGVRHSKEKHIVTGHWND